MLISISQLDAKWLLEHQLAQNRARRAREAAETEVASNKRKLESGANEESTNGQPLQTEENPAKRIKFQHSPRDIPLPPEQTYEDSAKDAQTLDPVSKADEDDSHAAEPGASTAEEPGQKASHSEDNDSGQAPVLKDKKSNKAAEPPQDKPVADLPEEPKEQIEQTDQTANDEDMNFESMFGDANAGNDQNNDLNFDLDLNPENLGGSNPFDSVTHDANNLELLPGLESYANASGDEFGMLNLPSSTTANQTGIRALDKNFDLPEIQGDSNFNDLFADGDFGGDASLLDLDLEDGFFNT